MTEPILVGNFRLSPEFFIKTRLVNRCREQCHSDCCDEGVWLSVYEAERIQKRAEEIQPRLVEPFDFQSWDLSRPAYLGTPLLYEDTPRQQCWFFTRERRCALHSLALEKGFPVSAIKPYFCSFFPLTLLDIQVNETEIALDAKAYETCLRETDGESWMYLQFENELRHVIGDENFEELRRRFPD